MNLKIKLILMWRESPCFTPYEHQFVISNKCKTIMKTFPTIKLEWITVNTIRMNGSVLIEVLTHVI